MKDIVYTRRYKDQKGEERKEYITVGYMFEKDGRTSILMKPYINVSALTNDKGEVWLGVYDHKTKEQRAEQKAEGVLYKGAETVAVVREAVNPQPMTTTDNNDDVPF
jgi:methionine synthase II (cobalamin-independent)